MVGTIDRSSARLCTASRICVKGIALSRMMFQPVQALHKQSSFLLDVAPYSRACLVGLGTVAV